MTVHIEEATSDVTAYAGDLPFSKEQIEKLVKLVMQRLEQKQRETEQNREATSIRNQNAPGFKDR